ncbi:hypothetical protein NL676_034469 [Syzygium grande]|nr:hypothetical protein NL676_034469 [Syzygium grande]
MRNSQNNPFPQNRKTQPTRPTNNTKRIFNELVDTPRLLLNQINELVVIHRQIIIILPRTKFGGAPRNPSSCPPSTSLDSGRKNPPESSPRETLQAGGHLVEFTEANLPAYNAGTEPEAIPLPREVDRAWNCGGLWHRAGRRTHPEGWDGDADRPGKSRAEPWRRFRVGDHKLRPGHRRERSSN